MEDTLSKLQKVCDELVTPCSHHNPGGTSTVYPGESFVGK